MRFWRRGNLPVLFFLVVAVWIAARLPAADENAPKSPAIQSAEPAKPEAPPPRNRREIETILNAGTSNSAPSRTELAKLRPLKIVLLAGKKDHGVGEHDYPTWQEHWKTLLAKLPAVTVDTAFGWPSEPQWRDADLVIAYYWNHDWTDEQLRQLDEYLHRGGGLVHLHAASIHDHDGDVLAKRLGLAFEQPKMKWRHGPVELKIAANSAEPITHGLPDSIHFYDEAYWLTSGGTSRVHILATSDEDGQPRPMLWTFEPGKDEGGKGRVACHVMGHYMWSFDDPLFRLLILRSAAWAAGEPIERFQSVATDGVRMSEEAADNAKSVRTIQRDP